MLLSVAVAFLVAVGLTPLLARWARRSGFLDVPNYRSSHVVATPRTGGAAFVPAFLVGTLLVHLLTVGLSNVTLLMVAAASGLAALGLADDLKSLSATVRLLVQTGVSAALVYALAWQPFPFGLSGWVGGAAAVFWMVALTNAYNFMDGIDGIAGGQAVVAGLGWSAVGGIIGSRDVVAVGLLAAAVLAGFLVYNWPPAKVFMGDAGSAFLGFSFAALPLVVPARGGEVLWWAALMLWPFLFDTGFTLLRRVRRRENILSAHRSHLYQRLTMTGLPHWRVSLLYSALAAMGAGASIALAAEQPGAGAMSMTAVAVAAFGLWKYVVSRESMRSHPPSAPMTFSF